MVLKELADAPGGYLYADEVCRRVGHTAIDSLIEYNIIHLRPYFGLCNDDLNPPSVRPDAIITAESQIALVAIREVVASMPMDNENDNME